MNFIKAAISLFGNGDKNLTVILPSEMILGYSRDKGLFSG